MREFLSEQARFLGGQAFTRVSTACLASLVLSDFGQEWLFDQVVGVTLQASELDLEDLQTNSSALCQRVMKEVLC